MAYPSLSLKTGKGRGSSDCTLFLFCIAVYSTTTCFRPIFLQNLSTYSVGIIQFSVHYKKKILKEIFRLVRLLGAFKKFPWKSNRVMDRPKRRLGFSRFQMSTYFVSGLHDLIHTTFYRVKFDSERENYTYYTSLGC